MADIFREVDEAMHQEKMQRFWHEYGPTLIAAAVLVVLGTAAGVAWKSWSQGKAERETTLLVQAIDAETPLPALTSLIGEVGSGPEVIARFTAAARHQEKGGRSEAAALYKAAASDRGTPAALRDLARVMFVRVTPDADMSEKMAVLQPVLDKGESPFIWQARIEAALIAAENQDYAQATDYVAGAADDESLPPSLAQRAEALHHIYSLKTRQSDNPTQTNDEAAE